MQPEDNAKNYLKKAKSQEFGCLFIFVGIVAIALSVGSWIWMVYEFFMWASGK
jgi:multidrug resistance efflux pump